MTKAWAAAGFAMFSVAMAGFRFLGGPIVEKLGVRTLLSWGGALIALGMFIVILSPWSAGSVIGFFLVGMGAANNAPLLMSQAARLPGIPAGIGVAATATGLTAGFLLAPPVIGFVAQLTELAVALGIVGLLGIVIFVAAKLLVWDDGKPPAQPPHRSLWGRPDRPARSPRPSPR